MRTLRAPVVVRSHHITVDVFSSKLEGGCLEKHISFAASHFREIVMMTTTRINVAMKQQQHHHHHH